MYPMIIYQAIFLTTYKFDKLQIQGIRIGQYKATFCAPPPAAPPAPLLAHGSCDTPARRGSPIGAAQRSARLGRRRQRGRGPPPGCSGATAAGRVTWEDGQDLPHRRGQRASVGAARQGGSGWADRCAPSRADGWPSVGRSHLAQHPHKCRALTTWQGGETLNRIAQTLQACDTPRLRTRRPRDHACRRGLRQPRHTLLGANGQLWDGRWDGGQLAMTPNAHDHRCLGHGSNDPECAASAQGTWGHLQSKYTSQEPRPAPGRSFRLRRLSVYPHPALEGSAAPLTLLPSSPQSVYRPPRVRCPACGCGRTAQTGLVR